MQMDGRTQTMIRVAESRVHIEDTGVLEESGTIHPATLVISQSPHLVVIINGGQAVGRQAVGLGDAIDVQLQNTEPERSATVDIVEDGMKAVFTVSYRRGIHRRLASAGPAPMVVLNVQEIDIPCTPYTLAEVASMVMDQGIQVPIEWGEVQALLASGESGACTCARGQPVHDGVPEHYELTVEDSGDTQLLGIIPVHPVITVRTGTTVARRVPAVLGTPGRTVLGQIIEPKPRPGSLPILGPGVLEDDQGAVVATRAGRMQIRSDSLDVVETLEFDGPLRIQEGHIWFDGDVVVHGDVHEGVQITAGGRVFIEGTASHAIIVADQGILIGGAAIACSLSAGTRDSVIKELNSLCTQVAKAFSEFVQMVEQMLAVLAELGKPMSPGRVATHIIDEKYERTPDWSEALDAWAGQNHDLLGSVDREPVKAIAARLSIQRITRTRDTREWHELLDEIHQLVTSFPCGVEESAHIQIKNAQNCTLHATGNIIATGQGFYRCTMKSGHIIRTEGDGGVILGCQAVSGTLVEAREIGSISEVGTTIEVLGKDSKIKADTIHPGTLLHYQSWKHRVVKEMKHAIWP